MEEFNLCLQPGFLRVLSFLKIFLNILRFVIPIGLLIKSSLDIYKKIIDPTEKDGLIKLRNRFISAVVIFLVPTLIDILMTFIDDVVFDNKYNGVSECWTYANKEFIDVIEKFYDDKMAEAYLEEQEKRFDLATKRKLIFERIASNRQIVNNVGEYANNENTIQCGTGEQYNKGLFDAVRTAGYKTREGVVAAAIYLSSHVNVHIPYFWSGGHFHEYKYNGESFYDGGEEFIGFSKYWGCDVRLSVGRGTEKQPAGGIYPFGLDCSGFVSWAIYNGGYFNGTDGQKLRFSTDSSMLDKIGGVSVSSVKVSDAKGKIKPGDVAYRKGHVGMVLEVHDDYYVVAQEAGADRGLVVSEIKYTAKTFSDIVLMDNFYENFQKGKVLWKGFY